MSALSSHAPNFLVVKTSNQSNRSLGVKGSGRGKRIDQTLDGAEGLVQIVQAGGENEFVVEATKASLLRVVKQELKVENVGGLGTAFSSYELHELRMVTLCHGFERGEGPRLGEIRGLIIFQRLLVLTFELRSYEAGNWREMGLFIWSESVRSFKVDGKGWYAEDWKCLSSFLLWPK